MNANRWILNTRTPLVSCQWGTAHFIFHPESGQTHFLNQTCADALSLISQEPLTTEGIYQSMLARYQIDEDEDLKAAIKQVSAVLEQLGVISSVS